MTGRQCCRGFYSLSPAPAITGARAPGTGHSGPAGERDGPAEPVWPSTAVRASAPAPKRDGRARDEDAVRASSSPSSRSSSGFRPPGREEPTSAYSHKHTYAGRDRCTVEFSFTLPIDTYTQGDGRRKQSPERVDGGDGGGCGDWPSVPTPFTITIMVKGWRKKKARSGSSLPALSLPPCLPTKPTSISPALFYLLLMELDIPHIFAAERTQPNVKERESKRGSSSVRALTLFVCFRV